MAHILLVGSQLSRLLGLLSLLPDDWNACTLAHTDDVFERATWSATRDGGPTIVALDGRAPLPSKRLTRLRVLLAVSSSTLFYLEPGADALADQLHGEGAPVICESDAAEVIVAGLVLFFSRAVGSTP